MIFINGIPHLDRRDLVAAGINESTIRQATNRHSYTLTTNGLVSIDQLPKQSRKKVEAALSCLENKASALEVAGLRYNLVNAVKLDDAELFEIGRHKIGSRLIDRDYARDIAKASAWLRLLSTAKPKLLGFGSKPEILRVAVEEIGLLNLRSLNIDSEHTLRKKLSAYKRDGWRGLISRNYGTKKALKVTPSAESALVRLYGDPRRFSKAEVVEQYNLLCEEEALPVLSDRTIYGWLSKPEVAAKVALTRYSGSEFNNVYSAITPRRRPSHPDDLWVLDGTPFELYYQDGKTVRRLYWVWVLDAATWKIVGYAIGETETGDLVRRALRMACRATQSLPHQLQFDNGSAFKAHETLRWMEQIATCTPTAVGNARAKVAEPFWAHMERKILKYYPNHSGGNVKAKRLDTHANPDFIKENWRSFPDRAGVERQIAEAVAQWNAKKFNGVVPDEAYAQAGPRRRELTPALYSLLFWVERKDAVKYTSQGLRLRTAGREELFLAPAGGSAEQVATFFADHTGAKFRILCDPDDLDQIGLLDATGKLVAYAAPAPRAPMALKDRVEGDGEVIAFYQETRKATRRIIEARTADDWATAEPWVKGGMSFERVHKDAHNRAEDTLKRREIMGELVPVARPSKDLPILGRTASRKAIIDYNE